MSSRDARVKVALSEGTEVFNVNVGIVGHVDSGKTSLSAVLSGTAGTAAFDKHPASQERGITIDMGFRAFLVDSWKGNKTALNVCLVDCPGHASLMKTVIGAVHTIELAVVVVDVVEGMQVQTAEGLAVARLATSRVVIALNKMDRIPEKKREKLAVKMAAKFTQHCLKMGFTSVEVVSTSAVGDPEGSRERLQGAIISQIDEMYPGDSMPLAEGNSSEALMAVDHCFTLKGRGVVMTGTMLSGALEVGSTLAVPSLGVEVVVKSMQQFHRSVTRVVGGDRVGVCVKGDLKRKDLERGLCGAPGLLLASSAFSTTLSPSILYQESITSGTKFHVTLGHTTVLGELHILRKVPADDGGPGHVFSPGVGKTGGLEGPFTEDLWPWFGVLDPTFQYEEIPSLPQGDQEQVVSVFTFEAPGTLPPLLYQGANFIISRLDSLGTSNSRIVASGSVETIMVKAKNEPVERGLFTRLAAQAPLSKAHHLTGSLSRVQSPTTVLVDGLLNKHADLTQWVGMTLVFSGEGTSALTGHVGGWFGKSGKIRVEMDPGCDPETLEKKCGVALTYRTRVHLPKGSRAPWQPPTKPQF